MYACMYVCMYVCLFIYYMYIAAGLGDLGGEVRGEEKSLCPLNAGPSLNGRTLFEKRGRHQLMGAERVGASSVCRRLLEGRSVPRASGRRFSFFLSFPLLFTPSFGCPLSSALCHCPALALSLSPSLSFIVSFSCCLPARLSACLSVRTPSAPCRTQGTWPRCPRWHKWRRGRPLRHLFHLLSSRPHPHSHSHPPPSSSFSVLSLLGGGTC